jgi:hypothetical protein
MTPPATISKLAQTHLDSVQQLQDDHDRAVAEIGDLRQEVARLTAQVEMQNAELANLRARSRYYEHFSIALVTKLYDVGHIITSAIAEAREKGHKVESSPLSTSDQASLEAIAAKLTVGAEEETTR